MSDRPVHAVVDTNVLVSALWNKNGSPARVVEMILRGELSPCVSFEIMREYREVLFREKFGFMKKDVNDLLACIEAKSRIVTAVSSVVPFIDESDRKFYDIAKICNVVLITGNVKHYPDEPFIETVNGFLAKNG
ncbi:MAG: putative toxin-antitoxin system toxin component, PIN family [Oscillospiraceae bacterium]|jgi:putative PIN family toxin of toxin-antitoxin system|nr:putative toxin-antitoxin system toxin component, PIN family [Oscillospiraceae bacterium]